MSGAPYQNSVASCIEDGMRNAGFLEEGQTPNSQQYAMYLNRINKLLNVIQVDGLRLWLNQDISIPLTQGVNVYTLGPGGTAYGPVKPTRIIEGYYLDATGVQRPLIGMARNDWDTISQKSTQGAINSFFVDKQATKLWLYLWLTPDATAATGTVHVIIQQQQTNPASLTEDMILPVEWFLALSWLLADEISTGQPDAVIQRCAQKAMYYRDKLDAWDVEDASTMFAPDPRQAFVAGRFK